MREMASCEIFQHKSANQERGQFWQKFATNRNYQWLSSEKKYKKSNLLVKIKVIFNAKKLQQ